MAIHAAEAHDIETRIAEAAEATESLARRFFGPAAYVRRETETDPESGDEMIVFEVHYCFADPENGFDRLVELHQAFTSAFVRQMTPGIASHVVLAAVPVDADQA